MAIDENRYLLDRAALVLEIKDGRTRPSTDAHDQEGATKSALCFVSTACQGICATKLSFHHPAMYSSPGFCMLKAFTIPEKATILLVL